MTERFEIQLSHACNNRCVFCVSGQQTELHRVKRTNFQDIDFQLTQARERGAREVTILGGEPTINAVFLPAFKRAVELGFEDIVVFTNGARLDRPQLIDKMLELRDNIIWRISIQGWDEQTHDLTTKKPGAFARIVTGLDQLAARGQHVTCNMCIVEQNYRSLSLLPDFIRRWPIRQVHLDLVRPRDAGERSEDYLDSITPDYADLSRVLGDMYRRVYAWDPEYDLTVGNLPYCQLPEWAHQIHHGGSPTLTVSAEELEALIEPWNKYDDKRTDKWKLDSCKECCFERRCDGFVDLYARRRGTDGFKPVSAAKLLELDPQQKSFVHQLDPFILGLQASGIEGWALEKVDDSAREGWVRLRFTGPLREPVKLLLLPASAPGGGDGEHAAFVLRVESSDGDFDTLAVLANAVFERLAVELPGELYALPSADRLRARRDAFADGSGVPPKAQLLARRLLDASPVAGWQVAGALPTLDPPGVSLSFKSPSGESADLHFVGRQGGLSINWQFDGPGDMASRRRVALAVKQLLQG